MPLYEYYCNDCHTKFEILRPMAKADEPIQCQSCQSMSTSRTLSLFAARIQDKSGSSSTSGGHTGGGCCGGGMCRCSH